MGGGCARMGETGSGLPVQLNAAQTIKQGASMRIGKSVWTVPDSKYCMQTHCLYRADS